MFELHKTSGVCQFAKQNRTIKKKSPSASPFPGQSCIALVSNSTLSESVRIRVAAAAGPGGIAAAAFCEGGSSGSSGSAGSGSGSGGGGGCCGGRAAAAVSERLLQRQKAWGSLQEYFPDYP
jgi:hypothetical protein